MKHIKITNLEQLSMMFTGETLKQKRELLGEAALMTAVVFAKDKANAEKMAASLEALAKEIEADADRLSKRLNEAVLRSESAAADFVEPLVKEAERLKKLAASETKPIETVRPKRTVEKASISLEEAAALEAKAKKR